LTPKSVEKLTNEDALIELKSNYEEIDELFDNSEASTNHNCNIEMISLQRRNIALTFKINSFLAAGVE